MKIQKSITLDSKVLESLEELRWKERMTFSGMIEKILKEKLEVE